MTDSEEIGVDVIDARGALGIVIFRETPAGVDIELKGLQVSKAEAARMFYALAVQLKRQALAEADLT